MSKYLTEMDLRTALGLKSAQDARLDALLNLPTYVKQLGRVRVLSDLERGTGRTTNLIVDALMCVQAGCPVLFEAANPLLIRQITDRCREYALKLDLDTRLVLRNRTPGQYFGLPLNLKIFRDHYTPSYAPLLKAESAL